MLSGEKTTEIGDDGFKVLDWTQIKSLEISYNGNSCVGAFEFYNAQNQSILKVGEMGEDRFKVNLKEGDRVVGIKAHKRGDEYINLQLIMLGPQ